MKKHIANTITGCRVLGSICLLLVPVHSVLFSALYLFCGLSDMVDGAVARKTNSISEFGARLDTAADFLFTAAVLIRVLPVMPLPGWLWIWIAVIAIMKIGHTMWGLIHKKKLLSFHTIMNKTAGLALFLLPLTRYFVEGKFSSVAVCSIATVAAIQEGYLMKTGREIV